MGWKQDYEVLEPSDRFDIKSFYELGGAVVKLDELDVREFEMIYDYAIEWEEDPDGVFQRVPKGVRPTEEEIERVKGEQGKDAGMRSNYMNEITLSRLNPTLKNKVRGLLKGDVFETFSRTFDLEIPFIDLWDGSEGCQWHWDGIECAHFLVLVYITEHACWHEKFGGQLLIGKHFTGVDHQSSPTDKTVQTLGVIEPANGTMVVVNNHNPFLVHKCNLLKEGAGKRVTLTFGVKLHKKEVMSAVANVFFTGESRG